MNYAYLAIGTKTVPYFEYFRITLVILNFWGADAKNLSVASIKFRIRSRTARNKTSRKIVLSFHLRSIPVNFLKRSFCKLHYKLALNVAYLSFLRTLADRKWFSTTLGISCLRIVRT